MTGETSTPAAVGLERPANVFQSTSMNKSSDSPSLPHVLISCWCCDAFNPETNSSLVKMVLSPDPTRQREPAAVDGRWAEGWKPQRLSSTCLEYLHRSHSEAGNSSSATLQPSFPQNTFLLLWKPFVPPCSKDDGRPRLEEARQQENTVVHYGCYIVFLNIWLCMKRLIPNM